MRTRSIKLLVLDEADEMLAKGITLCYESTMTPITHVQQDLRNRFMISIVICHQPLRYCPTTVEPVFIFVLGCVGQCNTTT